MEESDVSHNISKPLENVVPPQSDITGQNVDTIGYSQHGSKDKAGNGSKDKAKSLKTKRGGRKTLAELEGMLNAAKKHNNEEVLEEKRYHANEGHVVGLEKKQAWKEATGDGITTDDKDYYMHIDAAANERKWEKDQKKKESKFGWNVFNSDTNFRHYEKKTNKMHIDKESYEAQKAIMKDKFYNCDISEAVENHTIGHDDYARLSADVDAQMKKRSEFNRRRAQYVDEETVDFINYRNRNFNKKLDRAFGDYSLEVKKNLERRTAL